MSGIVGTRLPGEQDRYPMAPGSYGKTPRGTWECCTPNGRLGSLANHTVTEHDDGTISVQPSILVHPIEPVAYTPEERVRMVEAAGEDYVRTYEAGRPGWHGFLTKGVWTEV